MKFGHTPYILSDLEKFGARDGHKIYWVVMRELWKSADWKPYRTSRCKLISIPSAQIY